MSFPGWPARPTPLSAFDRCPRAADRHALLAHLVSRYGLPQNYLFEQAALSVLLVERYPEARCRAVLTEWIVSTAHDDNHANIVTDRAGNSGIRKVRDSVQCFIGRGSSMCIHRAQPQVGYIHFRCPGALQVVLRPLRHPVPLPALRALFSSDKSARPPSPTASQSSTPALSTSPTDSSYVLVPRPTPTKHHDQASAPIDENLFSLFRRSRSIGNAGSPSVSRLRSRPIAIAGGGGGGGGGAMAPALKQEEDEETGFSFVSRGTTAPF